MPDSGQVQAAVDQLAATLGHAVLIEDGRHRPLWWSVQGEVDTVRAHTILQRTVGPEAVALVARMRLATATGPVRTPAVPEADMQARWCVPMRDGTDLLGYLWVLDGDGTVAPDQLPGLVACADLAASVLARQRASDQGHERRRSALLARLAKGADADAATELVALENLDADATVVVYGPARAGGWGLGAGLSVHLQPVPGDPPTSGPPLPLADLRRAVERADSTVRALRAGALLRTPSWDALGAWHLVVAAPADLSPGDIHPGVRALAALPRADLLTTARVVLELGGDVARATAELHIHRTTLYYRLDRIEAVAGVDLKAGPDRGDLLMALRLAAYREA
ncbi:helix-turn-helix domain-containing protein [Virgisporangium aurantiacum]|uniref:Transcriptional regulator n=1 Tax=Virgisporangium aurantiacum TaxID=175570 RepID=A0A8J4E018_9ACTN|nr:helix-turn-helix domain-containing protein [Virgisporangium aurantiacum]GIJ56306.1 transcriptional regulator [Virgisporangium aurantiacum]